MRVAISGSNSSIGRAVVRACTNQGIEVVCLNRSGRDEKFDLANPIQLKIENINAFIHLAWDWEESYAESRRRNVENILPFLDYLRKNKVKVVLLSTESAAGIPKSNYGKLKNKLENEFAERGGTAVRAGLLWGSEISGIVATICKLSKIPIVCPHLSPDPSFYVTNEDEIALELVSQAMSPYDSDVIVSLKSESQIKLSEIFHASGGSKSKLLHLAIGVKALILMGELMGKLRVKLPFRVDSLRSLLAPNLLSKEEILFHKNTSSSSEDFLRWLVQSRS